MKEKRLLMIINEMLKEKSICIYNQKKNKDLRFTMNCLCMTEYCKNKANQ